MCGRITQYFERPELSGAYLGELADLPKLPPPRFNGCPMQTFIVLRQVQGEAAVAELRWGLEPAWADQGTDRIRPINARAETIDQKPMFRSAFRARRCVVPVNNWFEWKGPRGRRQPHAVAGHDQPILSLAGLWEPRNQNCSTSDTFTIVTTVASSGLAHLHHRQPAVLRPSDVAAWLDPETPRESLLTLARTPHPGPFHVHRVSTKINNPRNDRPDLLLPESDLSTSTPLGL